MTSASWDGCRPSRCRSSRSSSLGSLPSFSTSSREVAGSHPAQKADALMPSARLPSSGFGISGGEVVVETFDSRVLKGNALGDPTKRDVAIYLPPKYDPTKRYPAAYGIVGYTGTGKMLLGVDPLGEDLTSKLDRLIRTGKMGPMIVPLVDCF